MGIANRPTLADRESIEALRPRTAPYWNIIEYCRHIGVQRHPRLGDFWVARVRKAHTGQYRQRRLAPVDFANVDGIDYQRALVMAFEWFALPETSFIASAPYPVGPRRTVRYEKKVEGFTVGDAMCDYVDWKRIAAAKTHFETTLSLVNYHIIPRLGDTLVSNLTARLMTDFMIEVLETPPKYGNQQPRPRVRLDDLDGEALRKRKKTVNTILSILRCALQMAWENGEVESERAWRCIRRLPHKDTPRDIFLTRDQCRSLISHCRDDLAEIVRGALYTGCRVAELSDMRVSDVEPGMRGVYVAPCKSYRGRYVHLPDEGLAFFRAQCVGKASGDRVFLMRSGRPWRGNHKLLFRQAVSNAGLPERFVFHGLRHTYASQLVQAGTPLAIVARQLGHSNTDTVSRTYGHLSCDAIEREIRVRFEAIEGPVAGSGDGKGKPGSSNMPGAYPIATRGSWPLANHAGATGSLIAKLYGR